MGSVQVDRLASVGLRYRLGGGAFADTTLDRVQVKALVAAAPVREFRWYKGRTFYSGWYWSATTRGLVAYESRLELARLLLADFDPQVCGITAQPFFLAEQTEAGLRRHVPDFLLHHENEAVTVVDVKPQPRLVDQKVREVFAWAGELFRLRGWAFEVWSGAEATLLDNVRFLAGYRRRNVVDETLFGPVADLVDLHPTIGGVERAAEAGLGPPHVIRPVLLHLLWSGVLSSALLRPLGPSSPLSRTGR